MLKLPFINAEDSWKGLQAALVALTLAILLGIWWMTFQRFEHEEQLLVRGASATQSNLNTILSENLTQVLGQSHLYRLAASNWFEQSTDEAEAHILGMLASDQVFSRSALFDAEGRILFASSVSSRDDDLRDLIRRTTAEKPSSEKPSLVVGPLSQELGESWHVPLLLPLDDGSGRYRGALLLVLDLGYFLHLYRDIDFAPSGNIHVLLGDGREIARMRRGGLEFGGEAIADPSLITAADNENSFIAPVFGNGMPYLISSRKLEHYPFITMVNQELEEVLQHYRSSKSRNLITLALLTLLILVGVAWLVAMLREQRRSYVGLLKSQQEKRELIAQLKEEKRRAVELASHDHLTGLTNRRTFMALAASHLRLNSRRRLISALVFIDLDRFKAINDSLGHYAGDALLQAVASRLRAALRESDLLARLGGDEFVVMLNGLEREEDIPSVAQKIVDAVSEPVTDLAGHVVQASASIGIALYPRDGLDVDTLIHHADLAMYQSKKLRKGSYTFFDESLNVGSVLQFDLEQRFPQAIKADEFVLHFQPKVSLRDYRIVGFEALVRWQHPEHGLLYPGDFIPLAENTGHIVALGNWVIGAVCRQLQTWKRAGLATCPVAINIAPRQLQDKSLIAYIDACLARHDLGYVDITLEITESDLVQNISEARGVLEQLVDKGVQVALDDFGNGFSSLGYIKTLPIQTIKIDRTFIRDIRNNPDDAVIVNSTITLAHNLGMRVVAEGVETRDQIAFLRTAGCDEVQGYYLSRPVMAEKAGELLREEVLLP